MNATTETSKRRQQGLVPAIQRLGWPVIESLISIGNGFWFLIAILKSTGACIRNFHLVIHQIYMVGTLAMTVIVVSGVFLGFVLGLQFFNILDRYGQTSLVGLASALTLYRELGPVLTAFLFIGCSCTAMTAALGLKKSSEQIAAMEVMAVDPIEHEVAPRFFAGIISLPMLTVILLALAIFGTYLIAVVQIGVDAGTFWGNIRDKASFFGDVTNGLFKSFVFGFVSTLIALYQGYRAIPTAEGVAKATTRTFILASVSVLALDFIISALTL